MGATRLFADFLTENIPSPATRRRRMDIGSCSYATFGVRLIAAGTAVGLFCTQIFVGSSPKQNAARVGRILASDEPQVVWCIHFRRIRRDPPSGKGGMEDVFCVEA